MQSVNDAVHIPVRGTINSAGYDFYAPEDIILYPNQYVNIDLCIKFDGTETVSFFDGQIKTKQFVLLILPRSGLSFRTGHRIINTVAVIDADYRDTISAKTTVDTAVTIHKGDRFLQGIFVPYGVLVGEETPVATRQGGFGSTGN